MNMKLKVLFGTALMYAPLFVVGLAVLAGSHDGLGFGGHGYGLGGLGGLGGWGG